MTFFATEMVELIKARFGGNQQRFSKATGIDPSMVSRQCSGRSRPDWATMKRIVDGVAPAEAARLVAAYLRDVCPPSVRGLVQIRAAVETLGDTKAIDTRHLLDLSNLTLRDEALARELVDWLQKDPAAADFLRHAVGLVNRSKLNVDPC